MGLSFLLLLLLHVSGSRSIDDVRHGRTARDERGAMSLAATALVALDAAPDAIAASIASEQSAASPASAAPAASELIVRPAAASTSAALAPSAAGAGASSPNASDAALLFLAGTAAVSMASDDASMRDALAWAQSMRAAGTRIPTLLVLLCAGGIGAPACGNESWRAERGRAGIGCGDAQTVAEEVVSAKYLRALERLRVEYKVIHPLPQTPYTKDIPGGARTFWGACTRPLKRVFSKQHADIRAI